MTPGPAFQRCATYCSVGIPFADSVVQVHEAYNLAWVDFSAQVQANSEAREALECVRAEGREEGREAGRADGHAEGHAEGHAKGLAEGLAEAAKARAEGLAEAEKARAEGIAEAEKARAEGLAEAAKARAEVAAYEAERHELFTRLSVLERCQQQDLKPALAADATSSADI
ncbi:hypothetical protein BDN67DRAFT_976729 [Paxillus ammoniavirescens]|nr:hypothetical protein BDN67DRAFT_976729 [Paxillus ammoniavirescens]